MAIAEELTEDPHEAADEAGSKGADGKDKKGEKPAHFGKGPAPDPDGKKKHKDNLIIIGVSFGLLILTYLIYKGKSTAAATTTNTSPGTNGYMAGGGTGTDPAAQQAVSSLGSNFTQFGQQYKSDQAAQTSAMQGFATMLTNLGNEITAIQATPASNPPQSTLTTQPMIPATSLAGTSPSGLGVTGSPGGGTGPGVSTGANSASSIGGVFGQLFGSVGTSPAAASAYELGSIAGPGGGQYDVFDFPTGTSPAAQASALYGSGAPAGAGYVSQGAYTPSSGFYKGQQLTIIPNSPGQAAPSSFGY